MRRGLYALILILAVTSCLAKRADLRPQPCPEPNPYRKGGLECQLYPLPVAGYKVDSPSWNGKPRRFQAGTYKIDITPPPGFPMGGAGFSAKFGRGYWTRLYARAFFFRDSQGQSLAFVSCDLGAMAGGLQAKVARLLHEYDGRDGLTLNISRENLILAATHVHQGPGNFMSYKLYNEVASPVAGFDKDLFDKLAERIARAIRKAAKNAERNKGTATWVLLKEGRVANLLRNRAPEPFMLNSDQDTVLAEGPKYRCDPADPACRCDANDPYLKDCPRWNAVDERISVLEIHQVAADGHDHHIGSMIFLSVHPEAMSHETELYQSDFTGLAMSALEKWHGANFVAGFFNGADGDISVRWNRQNRNETLGLGHTLTQAILCMEGTQEELLIDLPTFFVARDDVPSNCYFATSLAATGQFNPGCYASSPEDPTTKIYIAGEPVYGTATLGGAEDARTPLFDLGWKPGVRTEPWDLQGVKNKALGAQFLPLDLTGMISSPCFYPETIPVSFVRIEQDGQALNFGVLPAELTRTAWWRIEKTLDPNPPHKPNRILPIGLANEYIGYVTTREEYAAQGYEGASTIYGPNTAELLRAEVVELSTRLHKPIEQNTRVADAVFYPEEAGSKWKSFGPDDEEMKAEHGDPDEALENLILDEDGRPNRHWPRFEWTESGIEDWEASHRTVEIVSVGAPTKAFDDDSGPNVLTVYVNPKSELESKPGTRLPSKSRHWMAIWLAPSSTDPEATFYFRVTPADHDAVCSERFKLNEVKAWQPPRSVPPPPEHPMKYR
jgi:neutral ceramidase